MTIDDLYTLQQQTNDKLDNLYALLEQIGYGLQFVMYALAFFMLVIVIIYVYKLFKFLLRG